MIVLRIRPANVPEAGHPRKIYSDGGYGPILVGLLPDGLMLTEIGLEPTVEKGPDGVMFMSMAMDGDLVWLASDRGVYSFEPGAGFEERWADSGVTRILPLSTGGLLLGTDGRGIVETEELW